MWPLFNAMHQLQCTDAPRGIVQCELAIFT